MTDSAIIPECWNARAIIVVPCFNERLRLPAKCFVDFATVYNDIAFIFVDDGSSDGTTVLLETIRAAAPNSFSVLRLARNRGKGEAVRQGLLKAIAFSPTFVGYWDADLATPLDELPEFIATATRNPDVFLVMGARIRRLGSQIDRSPWRHCIGRVFATLASAILGIAVYDTQCGAKVMRVNPALHSCLMTPFRGRWTFDVELIQRLVYQRRLANAVGGNQACASGVIEVPLERWVDVAGSKVRLADGVDAFRQLASLWVRTRFFRQ